MLKSGNSSVCEYALTLSLDPGEGKERTLETKLDSHLEKLNTVVYRLLQVCFPLFSEKNPPQRIPSALPIS